MNGEPGCEVLHAADEQPHTVEHITSDGVYIMHIVIPKAQSLVPQHSHVYDHTTMVAKGKVKVWEDGKFMGDKVAPASIFIKAGAKHSFLTLEDNTILYCIHNVSRTGEVEIAEEHQIVGEKLCLSA